MEDSSVFALYLTAFCDTQKLLKKFLTYSFLLDLQDWIHKDDFAVLH